MTTGEGGMVTTNNDDLAEKADSIRNHGREKTKWGYEHGRVGYNYRMTDVAAAIGIEQLKKLLGFNQRRIENARYLNEKLTEVETPFVLPNVEHVYHQYTIKVDNRDQLIEKLKQNKIGFGIYYPKPLHRYPHLEQFGHGDLKNSEELVSKVISLPVHPAVSDQDLRKISDIFQSFS